MRRMLLLLLALSPHLCGCTTLAGAAGGHSAIPRPVCFSRAEYAEIRTRLQQLKRAVVACERNAKHSSAKAYVECQALVARWQIEARTCSEKLQTCSARRCSSCVLPWLLVGVVGGVAVVLGATLAFRELTRKGGSP